MGKVIALTLVLLLSACATFAGPPTEYHAEGDWALESVQRPASVVDRWGEYDIGSAEDGIRYQDDLVSIVVAAADGQFLMGVTNRSDHSVRIMWESASYVGPNGLASRVVEGSARIAELNQVSPPITVPTGASSQLTAIPVDNIQRTRTGEHRVVPFTLTAESCAATVGASMRLVLPIEVQGETSEYTMHFGPGQVSLVGMRERRGMARGTMREVSREPC